MSELKRKILDIIFWTALIVGIVMILWRVFGSSPSDLAIIAPFIVMLISRVWNMNNEFKDFKYHVKSSFNKVKDGFVKVKEDTNRIENKIDVLIKKSGKKK